MFYTYYSHSFLPIKLSKLKQRRSPWLPSVGPQHSDLGNFVVVQPSTTLWSAGIHTACFYDAALQTWNLPSQRTVKPSQYEKPCLSAAEQGDMGMEWFSPTRHSSSCGPSWEMKEVPSAEMLNLVQFNEFPLQQTLAWHFLGKCPQKLNVKIELEQEIIATGDTGKGTNDF